jgi:hypothetical protein
MVSWMIVFSSGAFMLFKITQRHEPFYIYLGVGIGMLAAATATELNGAALTITYTIESGIIPFIAYYVLRDIRIAQKTSLLLIGPILLSIGSVFSSTWRTGVFHQDFFVLLILATTFSLLSLFFLQQDNEEKDEQRTKLSAIMFVITSIYVYVLIWLSLHASSISNDSATMISLLIYTVAGLATYTYGGLHDSKAVRVYGAVLLGFVVGRLLLIEVWNMEIGGRITTFFLVGILLMSTAFFGRKKTKRNKTNIEQNS